jgi:hypothetical protein
MRRRYVLAPEAALDLVQIWLFIKNNASIQMADRLPSEKLWRGPLAQRLDG